MEIESSPVPCHSWHAGCRGLSSSPVLMGLLEAICVIYLRRLIIPTGNYGTHVLPPLGRFPVEHIREACTLIMLLAVAWMGSTTW